MELIKGDITKIEVDAIVNAANSSLLGGSGVDGAIHKAGGLAILEECYAIRAKQGSCKTGEVVLTTAGKLPAKFVIHTVGPVWRGGGNNEKSLLGNCYKNSLNLAFEKKIKSMAFPNISTGIYGFPKEAAMEIAINTVREFTEKKSDQIKVIFVCYDEENYLLYKKVLDGLI
ncbi:MAG: O-acetyl-ADP-ribose deacetylase [Flammeovirgaceae bacterium]|nr:O-acetyl-ADP-ribose deacetylase [Flammeovirgaceae bacterium]